MKLFEKKKNLPQSIAFMALMAGLNVAFVLMTTFVPMLLFVLVFILPLCCTLVMLLCEKKYFPIYAFSTIGLCLICTMWNITDTLFYVIPSIITGAFFGLLIEKKINSSIAVTICSIVQLVLSYLLLPLIKIITDVDLIEILVQTFKIEDYEFVGFIPPTFIFLTGFCQQFLSYLVIKFGLKHLNYIIEDNDNIWLEIITLFINLLLTLLFAILIPYFSFIFFISSIFISIYVTVWLVKRKRNLIYILLVTFFFLTIFLIALLNSLITPPFGILIFDIYLYIIGILAFIYKCLEKRRIN